MTDYQKGVADMARNCLPAVAMIRGGAWTLDDMEKWLQWVIAVDEGHSDATPNPHRVKESSDVDLT